jgi:hypothetical protein
MGDTFVDRIREINSAINIRPARAEDAKPFTELMNKQYSRIKKEEYFYWQFMNPSIPTKLFVAYENDLFVGSYGIQVHTLNNSVLCGFTIDLLIREAYRNRALLVLFEEEAQKFAMEKGAQVMTSLPNFDGMRAHKGLRTWKHIGTVKTYTLPKAEVAGDKELPEHRTSEEELVYFSKSDAYRIWRYKLNPAYEYTYIKLDSGEFAVTKIFKDPVTNLRYGDIVDFECGLQDLKLLRELFLKACMHLKGEGVEAITTWALPHTPLSGVVESLGFTETQPERYFCFKALKSVNDQTYDFSRWHLVQADSEIY